MTASILIPPHIQFIDGNGNPLVGGKIYTYQTDMSTPKPSYTDYSATVQNTNPVILDASGRASIWITGVYGIKITDANDVLVYSANNVYAYTSFDFTGLTASVADLNSTTASGLYITTNYTVQLVDRGKTILANAAAGAITVTLPSVVTVPNGYKICIKKIDFSVNTITLLTNGTEMIDGFVSPQIYDYGDFVEILADGGQWRIVSSQYRGAFVNITANTTIDLSYNGKTVFCDTTTNPITITLPAISAVGDGFTVTFKTGGITGNYVTINPSSPSSIDDDASLVMNDGYESFTLKVNGFKNNWYVFDSYLSNLNTTGDVKQSWNASQSGWALTGTDTWNIGNAVSGAHYSGSAFHDLFIVLYALGDTIAPVTPTRSGNAEIDFTTNNCTMILPACGGCVLGVAGAGTGQTVRTVGKLAGGEEAHQLIVEELAHHTHDPAVMLGNIGFGYLGNGNQSFSGGGAGSFGVGGTSFPTQYTGSNTAHNNMQPTTFLYTFIKL